MRILMIGDVVGHYGCEFLRKVLPSLKSEYELDVVVANGENSANGNGILPYSADFLLESGVDVITTGNHAMKRPQIRDYFDSNERVIRPLNLHKSAPGRGYYVFDDPRRRFAVVNLLGRAFLDPVGNPFDAVEELLPTLGTKCVLVDFHAESTAEKQCMAFFLDGKVSAVVGTHTHVQTNDARILDGGTALMCDVGMCGAYNSVIGVEHTQPVYKMKTGLPARFEYVSPDDEMCLWGAIIDIDMSTGKATDIKPISRRGRIN